MRYFRNSQLAKMFLFLALGALLLPSMAPAKKKKKKNKKPAENEALVVGSVVDMQEQVIAGTKVSVTAAGQDMVLDEDVADEEGTFYIRITDPVGEYSFHLSAEGFAPFSGDVKLQASEQASIQFKMLDEATGRLQTANQAFNEGVGFFNDNKFAEAREKFILATENNPEMHQALQGLAEIYYREKNYQEAGKTIDKFRELQPKNIKGMTLAYTIHSEAGNTERSEELIDILAKTPKAKSIAREVYNEGVAASQAGDDDKAIERFRRAASVDPKLAPAFSSQATILYNSERYDEAEAALESLFALEENNAQGRRVSYLIADAKDDQEKAATAMEAYMKLDPDGAVDLMYKRADLDFRDGNLKKAITALEKIIQVRPDMPRAHYTLGLCHMSGDKARAKIHLGIFLELAPDDSEAASAKEMLGFLK